MTSLDICLIQWTTLNNRMQKLLDTIPENNFSKPIVSGGNSPSWLLGHLVDTDDSLLELLEIGDILDRLGTFEIWAVVAGPDVFDD